MSKGIILYPEKCSYILCAYFVAKILSGVKVDSPKSDLVWILNPKYLRQEQKPIALTLNRFHSLSTDENITIVSLQVSSSVKFWIPPEIQLPGGKYSQHNNVSSDNLQLQWIRVRDPGVHQLIIYIHTCIHIYIYVQRLF